MTFDDLVAPADILLDANTFIYHFAGDLQGGPACTHLLERIERQEFCGFTSRPTSWPMWPIAS